MDDGTGSRRDNKRTKYNKSYKGQRLGRAMIDEGTRYIEEEKEEQVSGIPLTSASLQ